MWLSDAQSQTFFAFGLTCSDIPYRDWHCPYHLWRPVYAPGRHALFRRCTSRPWQCMSTTSLPRLSSYIPQNNQILFISGLTLIIGPQKTFYFFARKQKIRGTACFLGGILLVFFKWPFVGMVVETFGFLNLFGYAHLLYLAVQYLCMLYLATSSPSSSHSCVNYRSLGPSSRCHISEV